MLKSVLRSLSIQSKRPKTLVKGRDRPSTTVNLANRGRITGLCMLFYYNIMDNHLQ